MAQAKALIGKVHDAVGPAKRDALMGLAAYAASFGGFSGRIFQELGRAHMDGTDLAVLAEAGDDPVTVGAYARGRDKSGALKLDKNDERALGDAVERQLKTLAASYSTADGGSQHADALRDATLAVAHGFMADGANATVAAQKAARLFSQRYSFDPAGWRMPAPLAAQSAQILNETRSYDRGGGMTTTFKRTATAAEAVRIGGERTLADLVAQGGMDLQPRGADPRLTDAQRQANYAATVASRARWTSLPEDTGLRLVIPSPAGGVVDVLDKAGKPVWRSWADLQARAQKPGR